MIYGGPGILAVVWLLPHLLPPPFSFSKLSLFLSLLVCRRSSLLTRGGGRQIIRRRKSFSPLKIIQYSLLRTQSAYLNFICECYSLTRKVQDPSLFVDTNSSLLYMISE
jgi:hypothetical protein